MIASHAHIVPNMPQGSYGQGDPGGGSHLGGLVQGATGYAGGPETRPKNVALLYCIMS